MRVPWRALFEFRLRSIFKHQEVRLKSSSWKRSGRPLGTACRMAALWGSFSTSKRAVDRQDWRAERAMPARPVNQQNWAAS